MQARWYAYHMCLVRFLPVQSLLMCFRSFLSRFADFVSNNSSSDTKAFLRFIVFSGSPTAVYRPLPALRYYTVGIPFWTTRKSHKCLKLTESHNTVCSSHLITHYRYVRVTEKCMETLHVKKMADLSHSNASYNASNFWTKQFWRKRLFHFTAFPAL